MSNTDKLVDYLLKNVGKLTAEKITALGGVIKALGKEVKMIPNEVEDKPDVGIAIDESTSPEDILKATKVQIEGEPARKVKIYETK